MKKNLIPILWILVTAVVCGEVTYLFYSKLWEAVLAGGLGAQSSTRTPDSCAPDTDKANAHFGKDSPETRLNAAIARDDASAVQSILAGMDAIPRNAYGRSSILSTALTHRNAQIVEALVKAGADPKYRGCGDIAMNVLAASGEMYRHRPSVPVAQVLVAYGAPVSNAAEVTPPQNRTEPIVTAALSYDLDLVRWLSQHGANVNAPDFRGMTPLVGAMSEYEPLSEEQRLKVVELFLSLGADATSENQIHGSALHLAVEAGDVRVVALLLQHHADKTVTNHSGLTPLEYAKSLSQNGTTNEGDSAARIRTIIALLE
jgi:ankyrin repeat protein